MYRGGWRGSRCRALGLGALVSVVAACGGAPDRTDAADEPPSAPEPRIGAEHAGPPERGDWLVQWLLDDPEDLNPLTTNDQPSIQIRSWIFSPLLTLDNESLELRPLLARELPEISDDKLTYTFRLRDDVTFSDGTPLTAHDVVFSMKAIKHPRVDAPHARNYFQSVRDAVAVDDHTVRFDLKEVYFRNTIVLGSILTMPRHHYDPENLLDGISVADLDDYPSLDPEREARARRFARSFNQDFRWRPLGPGPFVLRDPDTDYVTGQKLVLHHRADYWAPNDPRLDDAYVDRLLYRIINDREAALVALKNGDLDEYPLTPLQWRFNRTNARFTDRFETNVNLGLGFSYIGWNQRNPILADARVRRALSHFVDKQNLVDKVLHGLGVPVESPIYVRRPEYNDRLEPYPYDPARGRALLAEAGWTDSDGDGVLDKEIDGERVPLRIEIISNSGNDIRLAVGLAVIDWFKRAGIDASYRALDWSILLDRVRHQRDFDGVILGWTASVVVPDSYQIWHSSQDVDGGSNYIGFHHDEVDRILEEYRREFDPERRKQLYDRFQEILYAEQPYTFLFTGKAVNAWDPRFRGVSWYPSGGTDRHEWWVPAGEQKYSASAG